MDTTSTSPQPDTEAFSEEDFTISEPYDNVWDAIEADPIERERLKLMSDLMDIIERHMEQQSWTQKQAAKHFGVTQPRISDMKRGKMHLFSIDALVAMLASANVYVRVEVKAAPIPARNAA